MNWDNWAIVAYSFGFRKYGAGESNKALARSVKKVYSITNVLLILQKEIAQCIDFKSVPVLVIEKHRRLWQYLDTEEVTEQAAKYMKRKKISHVFLVAHPFLHRKKCKKLLRKHGFKVFTIKTGWVPFDKYSEKWWTRGPLRLILYAVLQIFFGRRGH